jgi:hypothetical protein
MEGTTHLHAAQALRGMNLQARGAQLASFECME